ncbi:hypothetical protein EPN95_04690 [Patescibacteria group bacterium]|nr:MAG: hypothetical protein EPN95_04690 [Patescibacteria group bacterium]
MWTLYDYLDNRGRNIIKDWIQDLEKTERMKLKAKLLTLEKSGPDLSPGLLAGTKLPHIDKIKVHGSVQPRLLLCRGPIDLHQEFTLLLGVTERDGKLPKNAEQTAEDHRQEVLRDPSLRRTIHE